MAIQLWRSYGAYYRGLKKKVVLALLLSVVQAAATFPVPVLVREIFNRILPSKNFHELVLISALAFALYTLGNGVYLLNRHLTLRATKVAIQRFRNDLLDKIYRMPRLLFTESDHGKLHTHIVQDTERVDVMSNALLTQLIPSSIVFLGLSLLLFYLDWVLALLFFAAAPLLYLAGQALRGEVRRRVRNFHLDFEKFSKGILFVLKRMDLTKAQSAEETEIRRQRAQIDDLRRTSGAMAWLMAAFGLIQNTLTAFAGILILVVGGCVVMRVWD